LEFLQKARKDRIQKILAKLEQIGIPISLDEVMKQVGDAISAGRPHFARALIAKGYVSSVDEAFDKYLAEGRPAYVRRVTIQPDEAIKIIHEANGVAVLPHPLYIEAKDLDILNKRLYMLLDWGLDGIEAYYDYKSSLSFLSTEQMTNATNFLIKFCNENDLLVTAGTDFHGDKGRIGDINVPKDVIQNLINYFSK
jgi:predicted metal-dependent phosphoesterase TrpH